jgi:hypothetical protein
LIKKPSITKKPGYPGAAPNEKPGYPGAAQNEKPGYPGFFVFKRR